MVVDSSALLAIFLFEPERARLMDTILNAETGSISAATVLETGIALESRRGEMAGREFDAFITQANLEVIAVDAEQVEIARMAWHKYGKGRHAAALNFGDCFTYALAKILGEPLLAKGTDFARTDIQCVQIS